MSTSLLILFNMMAISSTSWVTLWVMMEITTYLFLSLSVDQMKFKNKFEFLMLYFIISFIASTCFLFASAANYLSGWNSLDFLHQQPENANYIYPLTIAFLVKMGAIPFHTWVFSAMENLKWNTMTTLLTIQKIIPIWILSFNSQLELITITILISTLIVSFLPLKTKSVFYFLAVSATNNIIWILLSSLCSPFTALFYSIIYFVLTVNIISMLKFNNMLMMNQNYYSNSIMISMLSLMGIPPLMGFIPKLNTIVSAFESSNLILFLSIPLIISNSLTTIMYMKPIISSMATMINPITNKKLEVKKNLTNIITHLSWPCLIPMSYLLN